MTGEIKRGEGAGEPASALAEDAAAIWVWDPAAPGIVAANGAALTLFGARSLGRLRAHAFDRAMPVVRRLDELAASLRPGRPPVREVLHFWTASGPVWVRARVSADGRPGLLRIDVEEGAPASLPPEHGAIAPVAESNVDTRRPTPDQTDVEILRNGSVSPAQRLLPEEKEAFIAIRRQLASALPERRASPKQTRDIDEAVPPRRAVAGRDGPVSPTIEADVRIGGDGAEAEVTIGTVERAEHGQHEPPRTTTDVVVALPLALIEQLAVAVALIDDPAIMFANRAFRREFGIVGAATDPGVLVGDILPGLEGRLGDLAALAGSAGQRISAEARVFHGEDFRATLDLLPLEGADRLLIVTLVPASQAAQPRQDGDSNSGGDAETTLLAHVSHEMRTPLNSIIGFAGLLQSERWGPLGGDRYRGYVADVLTSARHCLALADDLLEGKAAASGISASRRERLDLNDEVRGTTALMQPQAGAAQVGIDLDLALGLEPVWADRRGLRQILLNLLANAIKHSAAGGVVRVSTARAPEGGVALRVGDDGAGMSEAEIRAVLEPQAGAARRPRQPGGHGIGLPLSRALAEACGARLEIRSQPRHGTEIDVVFPV